MRLSKDEYYIRVARELAQRSTCARRMVGCILVDKRGRVLSTGYNGVPSGMHHCIDTPCVGALDPSGDTRRCYAIHAEVNALMQCANIDKIHTVYVTCAPCFDCAKAIANTSAEYLCVGEAYSDGRGIELLDQLVNIIQLPEVAT